MLTRHRKSSLGSGRLDGYFTRDAQTVLPWYGGQSPTRMIEELISIASRGALDDTLERRQRPQHAAP
jgi:hypothetical protein